jgi:hypothetical protein
LITILMGELWNVSLAKKRAKHHIYALLPHHIPKSRFL